MSYTKICNLNLNLDLKSLMGPEVNQYEGLDNSSLRYYTLSDNITIPMFSTIKPDNMLIAEIDGSGSIGPHVDHGPKCVLNWYLRSNHAMTMFYKIKRDNPFTAEGEEEAKLYRYEDLELFDCFTATDNDIYLLDVSQVHAVSSPRPGNRLFLSLSWLNNSYEEVLDNILSSKIKWN